MKTATPPAVVITDLAHTAERIRDEFRAAESLQRNSLEAYRKVGKLLTEAKSKLGHGQWLPWLKANVPFSRGQASRYMRLAKCVVTTHLADQWRIVQGNGKDDAPEREEPEKEAPEKEEPEGEEPEEPEAPEGELGESSEEEATEKNKSQEGERSTQMAQESREDEDRDILSFDIVVGALLELLETRQSLFERLISSKRVTPDMVKYVRHAAEQWNLLARKLEDYL